MSRIAIALTVAVAAQLASAEQAVDLTKLKSLSIEEIMQIKVPTVYGASKHDQKITDAPSSVSIVTREEIQVFGYRTLNDVLNSVRDFYVNYDRTYSYLGVRGFSRPGDYGGGILLLVDGHRTNEPGYSSISSGTEFPVDIDLVQRVEIIRGPGSSLYGNNAFFAVINVVTRTGADLNGVEASGEVGSFETYKARLSYGKVFNNGASLLLSASGYDSRGDDLYFKEFDKPETNRGVARGLDSDRAYTARASLSYKGFTLESSYVWRLKDAPAASFATAFGDPRAQTLDERFYTRLAYAHEFESGISLQADIHFDYFHYKGDYPYEADEAHPQSYVFRDVFLGRWAGGEIQASKEIFKTHRLTLGGEYSNDGDLKFASYDVQPQQDYFHLKNSSARFGQYLQDEWDVTRKLKLNAGVRYDHFEEVGGTVNPRGAIIYRPWEPTTLKLVYGQAFRAPNTYELYYSTGFGSGSYRASGGLDPEKIRSYEAILEQELGRSIRLSASAFLNRMKGLIEEETDPVTEQFFYLNRGRTETRGVSLELEGKLPKGVHARASYTWQNSEDLDTSAPLTNSPVHLAKLNFSVPLWGDKLTSGFELQYTSERLNSRSENVPGAVVANWTLLSRELIRGWEASVSVYNLFDKDYYHVSGPEFLQRGIQQDGRTFRVKLTRRF